MCVGIAPDYVYVHSSLKSDFLTACAATVDAFYGKDPKASPDLARIVSQRHTSRLKGIVEAHRDDVVIGGQVDVEGKYVSPTILDLKEGAQGKAMEEELFGPILAVLPYTELTEVIRYVNSKPKPLALYVFSPSTAVQQRLLKETSSGGFVINDTVMHIVNKDLPFGGVSTAPPRPVTALLTPHPAPAFAEPMRGCPSLLCLCRCVQVGQSGMGSYHGKHGFLTLSHSKAVLHRSEWMDAPQRYPPYTAANLRFYRFILNAWRIDQDKLTMAGKLLLLAAAAVALARLGALGRW